MDYNTGHPTSQPIADEVILRKTVIHTDPLIGSTGPSLGDEEISYFKRQGFLVKRGLIHDPVTFDRVIDYVWENVPRGDGRC